MIEKLYTVEEVAELASVTGRTIRNYLKSGRLVGRKIGGQWRFPESEVQRLLTGALPEPEEDEGDDIEPSTVSFPLEPEEPVSYSTPSPLPEPEPSPLPKSAADTVDYIDFPRPAPLPSAAPPPAPPVQEPVHYPEPQQETPTIVQAPVETLSPQPKPESPATVPVSAPEPAPVLPPQQPPVQPVIPPAPAPVAYSPPPAQVPTEPQPAPAPIPVSTPAPVQAPVEPAIMQPPVSAPQTNAQMAYSAPAQPYTPPAAPSVEPTAYPQAANIAPGPSQLPPQQGPQQNYMPPTATYPIQSAVPPAQTSEIPLQGEPVFSTAYPQIQPAAQPPIAPYYPYQQQAVWYPGFAPPVYAVPPSPAQEPEPAKATSAKGGAVETDVPSRPRELAGTDESPAPIPEFSDVGKRVSRFISEVHDCSHGPMVCTIVDTHQSLSSAQATAERLAEIAAQESESGVLCQSFVEFDERYFIARYTFFGSSSFLFRCLKLLE